MARRLRDIGDGTAGATASQPVAPDASSPSAAPSGPPPRYRSAYSRFVLLTKFALPVIAGVIVVLVVVWPELKTQPDKFRLGIADIQVETAQGQRLVNARFTGIDAENRPFSITADSVRQAGEEDKGQFELDQPKADVTLEDSSWVAMASPEGTYWRDREILDLRGGVDMFHDDGYQFRTDEVRIDFTGGTAKGDDPVHGQGPFGTIDGEGINILDSGDRIIFTGRSRLVLYPEAEKPGAGK